MMIKILFVCHGNICRSPMAEFVMKDLLKKHGLSDAVRVASAATSAEELGNPVHRGTRQKLSQAGIRCEGKTARRLTRADYDEYDWLIGMDAVSYTHLDVYKRQAHCIPSPHIFNQRIGIMRLHY